MLEMDLDYYQFKIAGKKSGFLEGLCIKLSI